MCITMNLLPRSLASRVSLRNLRPCCAHLPLVHRVREPQFPTLPLRRSIYSTVISRQKRGPASSARWPESQTPPVHRSARDSCRTAKRFSTSRQLFRDHHFDTLKFVQRLKDEGFSEEQSKAMMLVLSDVIEESIQNLTRTMVLREGICLPCLSLSFPLIDS